MQSTFRLSAIAWAIALSSSAQADDRLQPEVVVTADRVAVSVDETLATVSVIDREEIELSGAVDVVTLLRREPGVDIARTGGVGGQASVFLRGTNANHVLVLIDGVRIASLNTGTYAWEHLPLDQIERIEIVRGPRAALYGSDAIGGVIQIFTRRGEGFDGALRAGNHDTVGASAGFGTRGARGGFGARASWTDSGGINAQNPDGFAFDPDDDGYVMRNLLLNGSLALGEQTAEFAGIAIDDDIEFDQGESNVRQHAVSAALSGPLADDWSHRLTIGLNRETLETPAFFSRVDTRREQIDWQHDVAMGPGHLLFGGAHLREDGESIDTFSGTANYAEDRDNDAVFLAWRQQAGDHDLEAAGRYDDNSAYGSESTLQAAWGWNVIDRARLRASWGEGFRAPTLNELYSPGFGGAFAGNPDLDAEHSDSVELGLDVDSDVGRFGLRAFRTDIDDLIDFSGENFQAINIDRARIDGVELTWIWQLADWRIDANATWQDAEDRDTGADLVRRPSRKAFVEVGRQVGAVWLAADVYAATGRRDVAGEQPGYGVLGLTARWRLARAWSLDARVENALDHEYVLVDGYNTPGQTVLLTLRYGAP